MAWSQSGNLRGPQGVQGPTGNTGPTGATGASGLQWRGVYDPSLAYAVNDAVNYQGSSFFATAAHAASDGVTPTSDPNDTPPIANTGWAILSIHGAQGATGATGADGAQGVPGTSGSTGPQGAPGGRGSYWFTGHGAPGTISGSQPNDQYMDVDSGNVYTLS